MMSLSSCISRVKGLTDASRVRSSVRLSAVLKSLARSVLSARLSETFNARCKRNLMALMLPPVATKIAISSFGSVRQGTDS
ncbi:hypothetical protein D9M69_509910 [compost metagenome]